MGAVGATGEDLRAALDAGEHDYVVVGAGSAGCVLAARLSERASASVLLLEAGPPDRHPYIKVPAAFPKLYGSRLDWGDRTAPQPALGGRGVLFPRGRVLGGSSSINAMMWVRGMPVDYERWAEIAGPSWSWPAVLSLFRRIEHTHPGAAGGGDEHGASGPLSVSPPRDPNPLTLAWLQAAVACGAARLRPNAGDGEHEGVALAVLTQRNGRRHSLADAYLRPARRRPNLAIVTGALVDRVVISGGRATGVVWRAGREVRLSSARRRVVLAAGAIGSPAILWRSGVGPGSRLADLDIPVAVDAPAVGSGLQDHLSAGVVVSSSSRATLAGAQRAGEVARYLLRRRGMLTSNVAEGYGFWRSDPSAALPDLELLFLPVAFLDEGLTVPRAHGITAGAVLLQPESRGSVSLRSRDPAVAPVIDPAYLSDPGGEDATRLAAGIRRSMQILATEPLRRYAGSPILPQGFEGVAVGSDAWAAASDASHQRGAPAAGERRADLVEAALREHAQTLYHPAGTCAMGRSSEAALDPQLALRGVEGLTVADASAIPQLIRGHTNAPTVVIAERAAEILGRG